MPLDMITLENELVLARIADYLIRHPRAITKQDVESLCGVSHEYAMALLLFSMCGFDMEESSHRTLFHQCFLPAIKQLDPAVIEQDAFMQLHFPEAIQGDWQYTRLTYAAFELFARDDMDIAPNGRIRPALGFFDREVSYPAVLQNGREWMTVTPNEIATMRTPISRAFGRAVTYGLGLGYYAFHAGNQPSVTSLTIVEKDEKAISLFEKHLLPQFPNKSKITIVQDDAFHHAEKHLPGGGFDHVFTDLWHDAGDGMELYLRMKDIEQKCSGTRFDYWIEKTLKCYL